MIDAFIPSLTICSPARARAGEGESILALHWPYIGPILALYWPSPRPRRATAVSGADAPETGGIPPGPGPPLLAHKRRSKAGGGAKAPRRAGAEAPGLRQRTASDRCGVAASAASARIRQAEGRRGRTPAAGRRPAAGNARPKAGPIAPGQRPEKRAATGRHRLRANATVTTPPPPHRAGRAG